VEFKIKLPEVTLTPQSTDAVFSVELSRSDVEVSWLKNGKPIKTSDKVIIVSEGCLRQLILKKVAMDDQADYTCVAVNVKTSSKLKVESRFLGQMYYQATNSMQSLVIESAPKINMDLVQKEYRLRKGEDVNITIKYSAVPQPQDEWTINGKVIKKSKRVEQTIDEASASLTIFKVEEQDCGDLTLRLKNNCGEASAEMKLIIMRKFSI
jgi:hypothetical protein